MRGGYAGDTLDASASHSRQDAERPDQMYLKILHIAGLVIRRQDKQRVFYSLAAMSKHILGRKATTTLPGSNAARFGPMELAYPEK